MSLSIRLTGTAAALAISALSAGAVSAATIDFDGAATGNQTNYSEDGFLFDEVRIVNGNCDADSGKPCGAENDNEVTTMTTDPTGGLFSVVSLWFQILGNGTGNDFTLTTDLGSYTFEESVWGNNNGGAYVTLADYANIFADITYLTFATGDGGNVRFDDIVANPSVAPVPLPAAGMLLLGGLGALGMMRRRRNS